MKVAPKLEFLITEAKILSEELDEKTGDSVLHAEVKWQQAEKININNRRYRKTLLAREIETLKPHVLAKEVYGSSYHPKDGIGESHEVTHLWEDIWMDEDGQCLGRVAVLPTSRGKDIQVIMRHGKIGMSSRGVGTTTPMTDMVENEKKTFEDVNDDFHLKVPGDFVLYPSVPDAGVRQLMESQLESADDSKSSKEDLPMDIKSKDELKAAYPELLKQVEEDAATAARTAMNDEIAKAVDVAHGEWQTEMAAALDERLAPIVQRHDEMLESMRAVVTMLTDIEGVVPLDEIEEGKEPVAEQPEDDGEETSDDEVATVDDLKAAYPDLCQQIADEAFAKGKAEGKAKGEAEEVKAEPAVVEAPKAVEPVKVEEPVVEAVKPVVVEKVEIERQKIIASGLDERGTVVNPDKPSSILSEETEMKLYKEARSAGFVGAFAEWKQKRSSK